MDFLTLNSGEIKLFPPLCSGGWWGKGGVYTMFKIFAPNNNNNNLDNETSMSAIVIYPIYLNKCL